MGLNKPYRDVRELPETIPVFPLPGVLLLPGAQLPLNIFEPRYMAMTDSAIRSGRLIGMIQPADAQAALGGNPPLRNIGCAGKITQFAETGDGRYILTLTGIARYRLLEELPDETPFRQFRVDFSEFSSDLSPPGSSSAIDRSGLVKTIAAFSDAANIRIDNEELKKADNDTLVNAIAMMGPFGPEEKQALLEARDLKARADTLVAIMEFECAQRLSGTGKLQ